MFHLALKKELSLLTQVGPTKVRGTFLESLIKILKNYASHVKNAEQPDALKHLPLLYLAALKNPVFFSQ
jgi:hypothetical protein